MARAPSAILTVAQQKVADTLGTLKVELKNATAFAKDLNRNLSTAKKAADKQNTLINKLTQKIAKLTPVKPAVTVVASGTGAGQIAKAA